MHLSLIRIFLFLFILKAEEGLDLCAASFTDVST